MRGFHPQQIATSPGIYVAHRILRFPKGTRRSYFTQLYIGFAVTGAVHSYGAYCLTRTDMRQMKFFMLQAIAITVEEAVLTGARSLGLKGGAVSRGLGYFWVFLWLAWCTREPADAVCASGMWRDNLVPPVGVGRLLQSHGWLS